MPDQNYLFTGQVDQAISEQLPTGFTYKFAEGALPPNVVLSATGALTGTPPITGHGRYVARLIACEIPT